MLKSTLICLWMVIGGVIYNGLIAEEQNYQHVVIQGYWTFVVLFALRGFGCIKLDT